MVVIDWWLLRPSAVASVEGDGLASVWLHVEPEVLWERERRNTGWTAGSTDPDRMQANFMRRSLWRNDLVAAEATTLGLPIVDVTADLSVDQIVGHAREALGVQWHDE